MASVWYYSEKNQQRGPVSWEDLCGLAQGGRLRSSDMVWQEGTADWVRASKVDGLFGSSNGAAIEDRGDVPGPRRRGPREEFDDEPRPRRARRRQEGMSTGLKVGLIAGGAGVLLVVVVVIIIILANSGEDNRIRKVPPAARFDPAPKDVKPFGGGKIILSRTEMIGALDPPHPFGGPGTRCKIYEVHMVPERSYTIDLQTGAFDAFLYLADSKSGLLHADDDGGEGLNSRIVFRPGAAGIYRIYCTSLGGADIGNFNLTVRED